MYHQGGAVYIESSGKASLRRSHLKRDLEELNEQDLQISGVFQKVEFLEQRPRLVPRTARAVCQEQ